MMGCACCLLAGVFGLALEPGDAVIENGRIRLVLEKSTGRAVLSYKLAGAVRAAAAIVGNIDGDPAARFDSFEPESESAGEKAFLARGTTAGGKRLVLRFSVSGERPIVECRAVASIVTGLTVFYSGAHAVLPEVFGDDLVLRPGEAQSSPLFVPAEHTLLHTLDEGDALLLLNWSPSPRDVQVHRAADRPVFTRSDVSFVSFPTEKVWVSVLAGKGIWQEEETEQFTISEYRQLKWSPPFPARYRADLRREGPWGLADSWMRQPRKDKFWMAFLSNGFPPLVIESGVAFLRVPRFRTELPFPKNLPAEVRYGGPALIYPFERETDAQAGETPEAEWTVLDVLRATLGKEWARALDIGEGILSVEPFPKGYVFAATCVCTGKVEELFSKGKEKEDVETIRRAFDDMNRFVQNHRERIAEFLAFAARLRKSFEFFGATHRGNAELEKALADLEPLVQYIPDLLEASRQAIQTPEACRGLTEQAVALVGGQGADRTARVKELGVAMRKIGGRQDDMLAGYRMAVKAFRQRAGQIHTTTEDPEVRDFMRGLRAETRAALRTCSPYEEFLFLSASWLVQKQ